MTRSVKKSEIGHHRVLTLPFNWGIKAIELSETDQLFISRHQETNVGLTILLPVRRSVVYNCESP